MGTYECRECERTVVATIKRGTKLADYECEHCGGRLKRPFRAQRPKLATPPRERQVDVVNDSGWQRSSSTNPMVGWHEWERRIEFPQSVTEEAIKSELLRIALFDAPEDDAHVSNRELEPHSYLLNAWVDHTSIF